MKNSTLSNTSKLDTPKFSIMSDTDFINVVKHNSIKWGDVRKVHLNTVKLNVRGSQKDFDFTEDLTKAFKQYFPALEVIPYQSQSRYVCEIRFNTKYVFINQKASFLITHFHVADSRFTSNNIYSAFSEDVVKFDAIGKTVKDAMCLHLEEFKKNIV